MATASVGPGTRGSSEPLWHQQGQEEADKGEGAAAAAHGRVLPHAPQHVCGRVVCRGEKRGAISNPQRQAVPQTSSTTPLQSVATGLGTSASSRAPQKGQMSPSAPGKPLGGCAQASAPHLPPGTPKNTLSPQKGSWLSPNPQPPTHLPGSSPSASRPGQAVPELRSKQGVTAGKAAPQNPKNPVPLWVVPPPPAPTNTFLTKLCVPTPRAGQGPRPGRDSARPRPRWAPQAGRGGPRGGGDTHCLCLSPSPSASGRLHRGGGWAWLWRERQG